MAQVTNYQCPSCNAPLKFSSKTNKLECEYCGSSFDVSQIDALYNDKVNKAKEESKQKVVENKEKWENTGIHSFTCPSCNAQIICDEKTVSTTCPYCSNPSIIPGQFTDNRLPDYIIPFKIEKKYAIDALQKFYKKKCFLPKVFKSENKLEEIKGVYVPFWLFNTKLNTSVEYKGTQTHVTYSGNKEITTENFYNIYRTANMEFSKIPVDASKIMDNAQMDSLEPFDYSNLKDFSTSYFPGYYAESYDDTEQECLQRMQYRAETSALNIISSSIKHYDSLIVQYKHTDFDLKKTDYVFLPVWILNTKWKNKNFRFSLNGQTGKMVGKLPVDWKKFFGLLFGLTLTGTIIISFISYMIMTFVVE